MDAVDRIRIAERLATRVGAPESAGDHDVRDSVRGMIDAGASRIGMRADEPAASGGRTCDLASQLARMIDHTALKPDTTEERIITLCQEAEEHGFASVCVNPCYVALAARSIRDVPVCTVISFPFGASAQAIKASEAERAIQDGASELDMVLSIGKLKSGHFTYVEEDIRTVIAAAQGDAIVKVILETALLTEQERVIACVLARNAGADFVKTSTGFASGGATAADVALMRRVVGPDMGVKASGGVRTRQDAETMIAHGATRIGASASVAIIH